MMNQWQAQEAKNSDPQFGDQKEQGGVVGKSVGEVPADKRAHAQPEHEQADDDRGGFDIDAKCGK